MTEPTKLDDHGDFLDAMLATEPDLGDNLAPPLDRQFLSAGYMCKAFNVSFYQLGLLMQEAGVQFAETRDRIFYLRVADAELVGKKCIEVRNEVREVLTAHER